MDYCLQYIYDTYQNAKCELNYSSLFELLIAVVLSAQTTDEKVNKVTPILFEKYGTVKELSNAPIEIIKEILKPLGMNNVKATNIIALAKKLDNEFLGKIPQTRDELMSLPGVGRKTANVVLAEGFKMPYFAVDTHILRICKRLGYTNSEDDALQTELKMIEIVPQSFLKDMHIRMIFFGRYFCTAKKPNCSVCKLNSRCKYYQNK